LFVGYRMGDDETLAAIKALHASSGYLADPHTIIGIEAARALARPGVPIIAEATAHPAKFPDAIMAATGIHPPLPAHLADLYEREERYTCIPAEIEVIEAEVRALVSRNAA
jgi:threonine synthase